MRVGDGESWIPTERTHWYYVFFCSLPAPLGVIASAFFWLDFPTAALWFRLVSCGGLIVLFPLFGVWNWSILPVSAVRISSSGVEVKIKSSRVFDFPRDKLRVSPDLGGFGKVSISGEWRAFYLDPAQFAAVKRFVDAGGTGPANLAGHLS